MASTPQPRPRPAAIEDAPNSANRLHREEAPAAVPAAAELEEPPAAAAASSGPATMSHVLKRVKAGWEPFLPPLKKQKKFDHLHVMAALVRRLETQKLKREKDGPDEAPTIVVEERPSHEFTKFFFDPKEVEAAVRRCAEGAHGDLVAALSTIPLISVPNRQMADEMVSRGYVKCKYKPVAEWTDMPQKVGWATTDAAEAAAAAGEDAVKAPTTLTLSDRVPDMRGSTSAVQVVRAFERVVVIANKANGQVEQSVCSPLRLWDGKSRKLAAGQPTRFSAICKVYVYIREGLKQAPEEITTKFGQLRKDSGEWSKAGKQTAGEDEKGGDEMWYERALKWYKCAHGQS